VCRWTGYGSQGGSLWELDYKVDREMIGLGEGEYRSVKRAKGHLFRGAVCALVERAGRWSARSEGNVVTLVVGERKGLGE